MRSIRKWAYRINVPFAIQEMLHCRRTVLMQSLKELGFRHGKSSYEVIYETSDALVFYFIDGFRCNAKGLNVVMHDSPDLEYLRGLFYRNKGTKLGEYAPKYLFLLCGFNPFPNVPRFIKRPYIIGSRGFS